jgi:signal transduction histidine kinase
MERLVQEILTHGLTALDKVKALEICTNALFTQQKLVESVESGITALELLGVKLPKKPSQLNVILELLKAKQVLKNTSPQEMLHLPQMQDRTELAKMRIMATLAPALFFTNPNLFPIMLFRMTIISAQHGIASSSAYAFGSFGFVLCGVTGEVAKGIEFGELALRLIKEREFNEYQARALFVVRYFIDHWHKKMVTNVLEIKNAYQQSLETGEADFTAFLGNGYVVYLILAGTPLEEAEHELSKQLQYITQNKQFTSLTFNNLYHQFVLCLLGKAENPALIKGKLYDIYTQEAEYLKTNNQSTLANQCYFQMQLSLLMGQIKEGIHFADVGAKSRSSIVGTSISLQMLFIDGLLRYHAVSKGISTQRRKDRAIIKSNIKKLEKIAQTCPADYQHKVLTLQACVLALQGKAEKARSLIMQAREYATENGNLYDQCFIALECYRFLAEFGEAEEATQALEHVLTLLQQWNGSAVIETLKQEAYYNRLLAKQRTNTREKGTLHEAFLRDAHETSNKATTGSMSNETVDIYSIVKGTQVITGELNLKNLIEKMLAVMSENAGAQRGVLILEQEHGQFSVQAVLADDGTILTIEPIHFEQHDGLCVAVINYVLHSGANLVIDNAASDARFMNDAYIKGSGIKSVLCSKIMVKSKIVGILYLENNLVSGAFTPNRIEVLNILGAQAAIAIENARYYSYVEDMNKTLEQKVQLRTRELEQSNQQLVELNNEKNELMGIVAHDLKNPIGAIRSFAELIENKTFTEGDAVDASRQIVQTSNRMLELVKNLLDINRLESGNMNLNIVAIDIATILDAAMWQYLSQAEAKNIRLELSNEATHSVVLADEQALMQVLDNLVSNAVKYSPLGKNIYIRIKSSDKTVRVEIQDEGEGISQEDMKKLFGKFARLSARPTGGEHSTGLGLSIVKKMVEVMNGHVWCESELGNGAMFIVELPKHP